MIHQTRVAVIKKQIVAMYY